MKNNNKETRFKSSLGIFILALVTVFSILMFRSYDDIYNQATSIANDDNKDYSYIQSSLYNTNFILNKMLKEKELNEPISYKKVYELEAFDSSIKYEDGSINEYEFEQKYGYYPENIVYFDTLIEMENDLKDKRGNLQYYAKNTLTNNEITNSKNDLKALLKEDTSLLDEYSYYISITYNEKGQGKIISTSTDSYNQERFYENNNVIFGQEGISENLKNLEIVYAIPKELTFTGDAIYFNEMNNNTINIGFMSGKYIVLLGGIMLLLGIFISYKKVNEDKILKPLLNCPFEILFTLFSLGGASFILIPSIIDTTIKSNELLEGFAHLGISQKGIDYLLAVGNVIYWAIIFLAIFGVIEVFKYIFGKGLFEYIKENTIAGKIIVYLFNKIKIAIESINTIDLKKDGDKYLLRIVAINFVIVSILCVFWFSGIFGTLIYSIVLFFVLRKYMNELRGKYGVLLDATNKIAEGNLDFEIEEDLKIFNPVKEELKKIQRGFKKAVEEEVKSQNMKTELITNVSHDLKTPLTSIITYVDLLKTENISEEDRKSYIETIDKKSRRLKTLIEDLFEVSKAGSRDVKLEIVNLDIVELIKQVEIEFSESLASKSLNIKWINHNEKVILPLDSQKTFRIFENLIGNITKYSMMNSRVYIEVLNDENFATITLKNISETEIDYTKEEIIERFNRGDKSRNTEGSGLGLAIAKNFTEIQNGEFNINLDGDLFKVEIKFSKEKNDEVIEKNETDEINEDGIENHDYMDADYIEKDN